LSLKVSSNLTGVGRRIRVEVEHIHARSESFNRMAIFNGPGRFRCAKKQFVQDDR
jgi:hypothetical protein